MFEKMIISILKFLQRITVLSRFLQKLLLSPNSLGDSLDGNLSSYWLAKLYSMKKKIHRSVVQTLFPPFPADLKLSSKLQIYCSHNFAIVCRKRGRLEHIHVQDILPRIRGFEDFLRKAALNRKLWLKIRPKWFFFYNIYSRGRLRPL